MAQSPPQAPNWSPTYRTRAGVHQGAYSARFKPRSHSSDATTASTDCSYQFSVPEEWLPPDVKQAIDHYLKLDEKRRSVWLENRTEDQYIFQPIENYRTGRHNRGLTRQMIARLFST